MKRLAMWLVLVTVLVTLLTVFLVVTFASGEKKISTLLERQYATEDAQFQRSLSALLGPPLLAGNRVQVLLNGDEIFPSMLAAIRAARLTITFETYIYWSE